MSVVHASAACNSIVAVSVYMYGVFKKYEGKLNSAVRLLQSSDYHLSSAGGRT